MSGSVHILHLLPEVASQVAHGACVDAFCIKLADYAGADLDAVRATYAQLSPNVESLVQTPQGWSALSRILLAGQEGPFPFLASVH
ncbi:hypothetical protein D9601_19390 [Sphingomonas sp. MA1305]|uniref:hypothetical protein n=1 Tax=Sphingomonas sp. MA1305 TaxID=2479204 RepID=UPI0018E02CD0|nr:hypothetical protein [Sphingomonas sp. MA1305]MBI0477503.1 hypothetical protein [Sphingomonas sp. MA1305]